jgi:hypothetical protein
MLANLLTLNVLQQKTIGLTDSDGLQNPALGKAAYVNYQFILSAKLLRFSNFCVQKNNQ